MRVTILIEGNLLYSLVKIWSKFFDQTPLHRKNTFYRQVVKSSVKSKKKALKLEGFKAFRIAGDERIEH